ncbi:MAG: excalibur calcium-binding domain-containing protein [Rhizobiaceae bacterium]|nr:excalibur calcium-binding domain-containing protein [Rhizobiaceae bacterium]
MVLKVCVIGLAIGWFLGTSPWPLKTTLRHYGAAPNCDFARMVGLAPASVGQPGYWNRHDADNDGIACEPYHGWRLEKLR